MMRKARMATFSLFISTLVMSLPACTVNMTKPALGELKSTAVYQERRYNPVDMKTGSSCALPPSISIVNAESRTILPVMEGVRKFNVNPKELTDGIIEQMNGAFERCGVRSDAASEKVMRVSLGETIVESLFLAEGHSCMIQLQIDIPGIRFNRFYQGEDTTTQSRERAMAFAVQRVVWKVIGDAEVRDYIMCRQSSDQKTQ